MIPKKSMIAKVPKKSMIAKVPKNSKFITWSDDIDTMAIDDLIDL